MIRSGAQRLLKNVVFEGNKQQQFKQIQACSFSSNIKNQNKVHGNLSDSDRIFTNLYCDYDWHIKGAEMRVCF